MLPRRTRKSTSTLFHHLHYGYLAQRAMSESPSAPVACTLSSHPLLLTYSRTTTQQAERSCLREVMYVSLTRHKLLQPLFAWKGYSFESEHLSFDKYRHSGLPEFHLSIRYKKGSEHLVVRVDFECMGDKAQRAGAISIKQYSNGEFSSAVPVDFEIDSYEKLIEGHAATYLVFFENLIAEKVQASQVLIEKYDVLEPLVAQELTKLSSYERGSEEARLIKVKLFELLTLIDQMNNYSSDGRLIGKKFILEKMAYFEEIISNDIKPQVAQAEEEITSLGKEPLQESATIAEIPLSYEENILLEIENIVPKIQETKCQAILGDHPQAIVHFKNTVNTFSILLIVLDIIGESKAARNVVDKQQKVLLLCQDIVRSYDEIEKVLLRPSEFKTTIQDRASLAFVKAIANEVVRECQSESLLQTDENKLNCFLQACAQSRSAAKADYQSVIDDYVMRDLIREVPLHNALMQLGSYLNDPTIRCDYIRTNHPTTCEIYPSRDECDKFPYSKQLIDALMEKGRVDSEAAAQKIVERMLVEQHSVAVFYYKGFEQESCPAKKNNFLTALAQRLSLGGLDGKENVRDTFYMIVKEINEGRDSHENCMKAQWLFSVLQQDRCVGDYAALLDVFNVLQFRQDGLMAVNYFQIINQLFLKYLSASDKSQVVALPAYVSLKAMYVAQLQEKVAQENTQRKEAGSSLGSAPDAMYRGVTKDDGVAPSPSSNS